MTKRKKDLNEYFLKQLQDNKRDATLLYFECINKTNTLKRLNYKKKDKIILEGLEFIEYKGVFPVFEVKS